MDPTELQRLLSQANDAHAAGDASSAREALRAILDADPGSIPARALLTRLFPGEADELPPLAAAGARPWGFGEPATPVPPPDSGPALEGDWSAAIDDAWGQPVGAAPGSPPAGPGPSAPLDPPAALASAWAQCVPESVPEPVPPPVEIAPPPPAPLPPPVEAAPPRDHVFSSEPLSDDALRQASGGEDWDPWEDPSLQAGPPPPAAPPVEGEEPEWRLQEPASWHGSSWDSPAGEGEVLINESGDPSAPGLKMIQSDEAAAAAPDPSVEDDDDDDEGGISEEDLAHLMEGAQELIALADFSGALEIVGRVLLINPENVTAIELRERCESTLLQMWESKLGPIERCPRVLIDPDEVVWLNLDHRAGFVLAQIDGQVTYEELFALSGMSRMDTCRILVQLLEQRVIASA
ncbi:MAG: hypothetical protein P1V51_18710 [Deltaproteobacteria bacterium]|nr:hypothetical protein [Deltaproteobacteria bacterium]